MANLYKSPNVIAVWYCHHSSFMRANGITKFQVRSYIQGYKNVRFRKYEIGPLYSYGSLRAPLKVIESDMMTFSDLKRRKPVAQFFRRISVQTLLPFDQQRPNSAPNVCGRGIWGSTTPSTQGAGPQRSQLLETPLYMPIYLLWRTAIKFRKMTKLGEFLRTPAPKYARILQPRATKFGMITHLGKRHIQGQPCPTTQRVAVWAPTLSIFWWPLLLGPTYAYIRYMTHSTNFCMVIKINYMKVIHAVGLNGGNYGAKTYLWYEC